MLICCHSFLSSVPKDVAIDRLVIAYEPIWAIGTGLVPTVADIAEMAARINEVCTEELSTLRIFIFYMAALLPLRMQKKF